MTHLNSTIPVTWTDTGLPDMRISLSDWRRHLLATGDSDAGRRLWLARTLNRLHASGGRVYINTGVSPHKGSDAISFGGGSTEQFNALKDLSGYELAFLLNTWAPSLGSTDAIPRMHNLSLYVVLKTLCEARLTMALPVTLTELQADLAELANSSFKRFWRAGSSSASMGPLLVNLLRELNSYPQHHAVRAMYSEAVAAFEALQRTPAGTLFFSEQKTARSLAGLLTQPRPVFIEFADQESGDIASLALPVLAALHIVLSRGHARQADAIRRSVLAVGDIHHVASPVFLQLLSCARARGQTIIMTAPSETTLRLTSQQAEGILANTFNKIHLHGLSEHECQHAAAQLGQRRAILEQPNGYFF